MIGIALDDSHIRIDVQVLATGSIHQGVTPRTAKTIKLCVPRELSSLPERDLPHWRTRQRRGDCQIQALVNILDRVQACCQVESEPPLGVAVCCAQALHHSSVTIGKIIIVGRALQGEDASLNLLRASTATTAIFALVTTFCFP